jgi:hypothetical protein
MGGLIKSKHKPKLSKHCGNAPGTLIRNEKPRWMARLQGRTDNQVA